MYPGFLQPQMPHTDVLNLRNKVVQSKHGINIYLALPHDFPFDIDDIIIKYTGEYVEILGTEIPDSIKQNMCQFYSGNINEFVAFVESNLEIFLKNEVPEPETLSTIQKPSRKPKILPDDYKLPISYKKCTDIRISAKKTNISLITVKEIACDVKCTRCGQVNHINETSPCKKCQQDLVLTFEPTMDSSFVACFNVKECVLLALNPLSYIMVCGSCNTPYLTKGLTKSERLTFNCYKCYTMISMEVEGVICPVTSIKPAIIHKPDLSGDGTCKHYRKSTRWFRFPCCTRIFPCDICHNEESNHPCEPAKKMVCGLCKSEQPVSETCKCGMSVAKKNPQFWEGGKGTRNKLTMSKKDRKKYKK